ncbi:MAG: hypothetical protein WEA09_03155 [Gemmatimonadota bacterium]
MRSPARYAAAAVLILVALSATPASTSSLALRWGAHGHELAARAAATDLPAAMPAFFRNAAAQLEYLNPEPDRWRQDAFREMNESFRYDHYIDLENMPSRRTLDGARDRYEFIDALYRAGLENPHRDVGYLPFQIMELYQRLVTEFVMWRSASPRQRPWIDARIINDAGILGHYVTDASQPHHTTIHFNGWDRNTPNPQGYTTDRTFHSRFESQFVGVHVRFEHLLPVVRWEVHRLRNVRGGIIDYIWESNSRVEELYRLDRDFGFTRGQAHPETLQFAVERLAAGTSMLRDLWWTAWVESGEL